MGNGASHDIEIFEEGELEAEFRKRHGKGEYNAYNLVIAGYEQIISAVIRPQRSTYTLEALGPAKVPVLNRQIFGDGQVYASRKDFIVENDRIQSLSCSHWQLYESTSGELRNTPCLIYLHSNMGCRVDALRIRDHALQRGMSVVCFDYAGCGLSNGLQITMGWNESKDLHAVLCHLEKDASIECFCLYAHSMSVYPSLLNIALRCRNDGPLDITTEEQFNHIPHLLRDKVGQLSAMKSIRGVVIDGGYCSMITLLEEMMVQIQEEGFACPLALMKVGCNFIRQAIKNRAEFDLKELRPMEFAASCTIPALFMTGKEDRYVSQHHSHDLAASYEGPSLVLEVDGAHYDPRPEEAYIEAANFLQSALRSRI